MTARRRKLLIAAALLVLAAALAWWVGRSGPEMRLELRFLSYTNETVGRFLSYTNQPVGIPGLPEGAQVWQASLFNALVSVTNCGGVAVELSPGVNGTNVVTVGGTLRLRDGFLGPSGQNLPRILKPGETMIIQIGPSQFLQPWSTEIFAQRRGFRDRLYGKVWDTGNPILQKLISRFPSAFADITTTLGPITNVPPETPPGEPPRVARP